MMLTPLSRYRSYGGALHQRANVIRSVEHIGRFRRSYSFNPVLGVSSTRTAQEHYRLVTDWKTPFEEQLRVRFLVSLDLSLYLAWVFLDPLNRIGPK